MASVSNFSQLCQLAIISNKILNKIYRETSEMQGPNAIMQNLHQLDQQLQGWFAALPPHLRLAPHQIGRNTSALPSPHIYVIL